MKSKLKVKLARIKLAKLAKCSLGSIDHINLLRKCVERNRQSRHETKGMTEEQQNLLEKIRKCKDKKDHALHRVEVAKYRNMQTTLIGDVLGEEIAYIEDAPKYIKILQGFGSCGHLTRQAFAKARVTFETMQLNTIDDYFLFFASANLLNSSAKRMGTGYEFKTRLEQAIKAISKEHQADDAGYNPIKDLVSFYSEKDGHMDCVYVTINGVQFSFHRAVDEHINEYSGAKYQKWSGIRLQRVATDVWEFANRLDNLTQMSLVRDDDYNPISLKNLQSIAACNCGNKNSAFYEGYKDSEDIFELPLCDDQKDKYINNLFLKISRDENLKGIISNDDFVQACKTGDVIAIREELIKLCSHKQGKTTETPIPEKHPTKMMTEIKDPDEIDPRDAEYYDDDGEVLTYARSLELANS